MKPLPPGNAVAVAAQAYDDHQKIAVAAGDGVQPPVAVVKPGGGLVGLDRDARVGAPVTRPRLLPVAAGHWETFAVDEYEKNVSISARGGTADAPCPAGPGGRPCPRPRGLPVTSISAKSAPRGGTRTTGRVAGHRQDLVAVAGGQVWHRQRQGVPDAMPAWSDWGPQRASSLTPTDVACSSPRTGARRSVRGRLTPARSAAGHETRSGTAGPTGRTCPPRRASGSPRSPRPRIRSPRTRSSRSSPRPARSTTRGGAPSAPAGKPVTVVRTCPPSAPRKAARGSRLRSA